jgi:hypothetical protein
MEFPRRCGCQCTSIIGSRFQGINREHTTSNRQSRRRFPDSLNGKRLSQEEELAGPAMAAHFVYPPEPLLRFREIRWKFTNSLTQIQTLVIKLRPISQQEA